MMRLGLITVGFVAMGLVWGCDDGGGSVDGGVEIDGSGAGGGQADLGGAGGDGDAGGAGGEGGAGGGACVPDCAGRQCGPDGCGGRCGDCVGAVCRDGQCAAEGCGAGEFECNGECSRLVDDPAHCGSCGNACPRQPGALTQCIDAECYLGCRGMEGQPVSLDFMTDPDHCGRCGNACPTAAGGEARCVDGVCQSPCPGADMACDGRCVDLDDDDAHCGACGNACPAGSRCVDGGCACGERGAELCAEGCFDLRTDPANCGACGNRCPSADGGAARCVGGECQNPCGEDFDDGAVCGGACVDLAHDPDNCGDCGRGCEAAFEDFDLDCVRNVAAQSCSSEVAGCGGGGCQMRITYRWDLFMGGGNVTCNQLCAETGLRCGEKRMENCLDRGNPHFDPSFDPPVVAAGCAIFERIDVRSHRAVDCDERIPEVDGRLSRDTVNCWCQ